VKVVGWREIRADTGEQALNCWNLPKPQEFGKRFRKDVPRTARVAPLHASDLEREM
jgi:hypothetical protein